MKFVLLEIKKNVLGQFEATTRTDPENRENVDPGPHAAGFYWMPQSKPLPDGFSDLKRLLCEQYKRDILKLKRAYTNLKKLPCPTNGVTEKHAHSRHATDRKPPAKSRQKTPLTHARKGLGADSK